MSRYYGTSSESRESRSARSSRRRARTACTGFESYGIKNGNIFPRLRDSDVYQLLADEMASVCAREADPWAAPRYSGGPSGTAASGINDLYIRDLISERGRYAADFAIASVHDDRNSLCGGALVTYNHNRGPGGGAELYVDLICSADQWSVGGDLWAGIEQLRLTLEQRHPHHPQIDEIRLCAVASPGDDDPLLRYYRSQGFTFHRRGGYPDGQCQARPCNPDADGPPNFRAPKGRGKRCPNFPRPRAEQGSCDANQTQMTKCVMGIGADG